MYRSAGLALLFVAATAAQAHPGGLNAEGCHNNRKTGDYHCHRASTAPAPPRQQLARPRRPRPRDGRTATAPRPGLRARRLSGMESPAMARTWTGMVTGSVASSQAKPRRSGVG